MGTTWLYRGYIRPIYGLYQVMGLGVPSRAPSCLLTTLDLCYMCNAACFGLFMFYSKRERLDGAMAKSERV